MALRLPTLVYDERTRVAGEFYLYYNLGTHYQYGQIGNAGGDVANWVPSGGCCNLSDPPVSGILAARVLTPIGPVDNVFTIQGKEFTIPAYSPPGHSVELDNGTPLTEPIEDADVEVIDGTAKDAVEIILLPNLANDVLLCFDQGFNAEAGDENRPIPRKFEPVCHYVRQRPTNNISLSELFVCNLQGLNLLRQRDVTLIGKFFPDGGAIPSQIDYYTGVRLNIPRNVPQESNDSVQVDATGTFQKFLSFAAEPT